MPYVVQPLVAGELGPGTVLDWSTPPPVQATRVAYVLDYPMTDDLIASTPVFLVSEELAERLTAAGMTGLRLDDAEVIPSLNYTEVFGDVPHKAYRWLRADLEATDRDVWIDAQLRLCVSDRMWEILQQADLEGATPSNR